MSALLAWLKSLPILDSLIGRLIMLWQEIRQTQLEEEDREALERRDAKHEEIRADPAAHARQRGWLRDDGRSHEGHAATREDGTPKDYDVSGKGGQLDRER